jgi:catechol 2,3-dioxygenase-like lactoylglutathione lyase family enzyme
MSAPDPNLRRVTVDHMTLPVADLARSRAFYTRVLATLGYGVEEGDDYVAFGPPGSQDFEIAERDPRGVSIHVAFTAATREEVQAWHAEALAAGATDNGGPGIREAYSPGYYAAFVLDPDGHNVEAVLHEPYD